MTRRLYTNNATSTLAAGISSSVTTLSLVPGGGSAFPNPGAGYEFTATLVSAGNSAIREVILCTARSGDVLTTIVRDQEGTGPLAWSAGDILTQLPTAADMAAFAQFDDLQAQTSNYAIDTGSANAYSVGLTPAVTANIVGMPIRWLAGHGNTGPSTFNVGPGAGALQLPGGSPLPQGAVITGALYTAIWNGTYYQHYDSLPVYGLSAAEIASSRTPTNYAYQEGDARRYGLAAGSSTGIKAANVTAFNAAILVSAAGGRTAYCPAGTWNVSAPIGVSSGVPITGDWSMHGEGRASVIALNSCNGPTFGGEIAAGGARFVRDLVIDGTNAAGYIGIVCDLDSSTARINQVLFSNVVLQNFSSATGAATIDGVTVTGLGAWCRGMWSCTFRDCQFFNCYTGSYVYGLTTMQRFVDCEFILPPALYNTAGTNAIICDIDGGGHRPEDLQIRGCHSFGYDKAVDLRQVLRLMVLNNDWDGCNSTCMQLTQILGTGSIKDNWMATQALAGANSTGINLVNLSSANVDVLLIEGNEINCNTASTASHAVVVGNNQSNTKIINNTITGFEFGATLMAATDCKVADNAILAIGNAIQVASGATNADIGPNNILGGAPLVLLSASLPVGFQYHARGTVLLTLTGLSSSNTGNVNWFADGSQITLYTSGITGPATGTAMTASGLASLAPFLIPLTTQWFDVAVTDNSITKFGRGSVDTTGALAFFVGADAASGAFTASGSRGISASPMRWNFL